VQNLLHGRVAIMTGVSRAIGAFIAKRFAADSSGHLVTRIPLLKQLREDICNLDGSIMTKKPDDGQGGL
jgi:NAD(P)-dependent dehydrogenase (short-subunit alcohol dehydrogenase family)